MIVFICLVTIVIVYYFWNPSKYWIYKDIIDEAVVEIISSTKDTIVVMYNIDSNTSSSPMNLSRIYFKTHFIQYKWKK